MSTTETKVRHTPGPWEARGYAVFQHGLALLTAFHPEGREEEMKATIQVAAAAPDMLEALEELAEAADYSQLRGIPDREASDLRVKRAIAAAQAVCTKAKGGAA